MLGHLGITAVRLRHYRGKLMKVSLEEDQGGNIGIRVPGWRGDTDVSMRRQSIGKSYDLSPPIFGIRIEENLQSLVSIIQSSYNR